MARASPQTRENRRRRSGPGDGGGAAGRHRSRSHARGLRPRQHQPDRRDRRRERRLALPVLPQQGGSGGGAGRAPQPGDARPAARGPEGSGVARPCNGDAPSWCGRRSTPTGSIPPCIASSTSRCRAWASSPRSRPSSAKPSSWSGPTWKSAGTRSRSGDLDSATSILVTTVEALTHEFVIHRPVRTPATATVRRRGHAAGRGLPAAGPAIGRHIALDQAAAEAHACGATPVVVEICRYA